MDPLLQQPIKTVSVEAVYVGFVGSLEKSRRQNLIEGIVDGGLLAGDTDLGENATVCVVETEKIIGVIQGEFFPFHKPVLVSPAVP